MAFAPFEDPVLDAAHSEGSNARHYRPTAKPPTHYTAQEKWAWELGWRLQESLETRTSDTPESSGTSGSPETEAL